ncbi:MAG: cob(I)yrinic acid a,c-diamide adenosyltransferase [Deltaproteobacteria bacterium]|nr:cob(I)yrinic acid a,c-diamide adenosyltransferase [Deltaproteobacteria bacterium]
MSSSVPPSPAPPAADGARFRDPNLAINRVYTRHGDAGQTRLVGGQQVSKAALRIESYGTVDELNAYLGAARLSCEESGLAEMAGLLHGVQNALFNLGSLLATLPEDVHPQQPQVTLEDVARLEGLIDLYNAALPPLRSFVLPGGTRANVELHMARTVCRRAERLCVRLAAEEPVGEAVVPYLNRLSDALFVWSRWVVSRVGAAEHLWTPNKA